MAGERSAKYRQEIQQVRFIHHKGCDFPHLEETSARLSTIMELSVSRPSVRPYFFPGSALCILVFQLLPCTRQWSGNRNLFPANETDRKNNTLGLATQHSTVAAIQTRPALSPHRQLHN